MSGIFMSIKSSDPTPTNPPQHDTPPEFFTDEEAAELFEKIAQRYLGISGDEFIQRWESGYYRDDADRPRVMDVAMSIPLVR